MRKITTFPSTSTHCKVKAEASFLTILLSLLPLFQTIMDSPLYLLKSSWILMTDSPGQKLGFDLIIIKSLGKVMNIKMVNSGCFPYRSIGVTPPYDFIQVQHSQQDSHASDQTICTYWGGSAGGSPSEEGPSQAQSLAQGQVSTTARAQTIVVQLNPTEDASFQTRASFLQTSSKNYITTQTAITRRWLNNSEKRVCVLWMEGQCGLRVPCPYKARSKEKLLVVWRSTWQVKMQLSPPFLANTSVSPPFGKCSPTFLWLYSYNSNSISFLLFSTKSTWIFRSASSYQSWLLFTSDW